MPGMNQNQGQQNQQSQSQQNTQCFSGQGSQVSDKDLMNLGLNEMKHMSDSVSHYILESANEQLRRDYMTILGDVYNQQKQLFDLMQQKGYYQTQNATQQELMQAQSKWSQ